MRTIYKTVSSHVDAPFVCDNNGKRVAKGVVFNVNDLGFDNGAFYYQKGFKQRRVFVVDLGWAWGEFSNRRLYKMRGGWFCIEKTETSQGGGWFSERYEVTKAEAGEIRASGGVAWEKFFSACQKRAV